MELSIRKCGTMSVHHHLLEIYGPFRANQLQLESIVGRRLASGQAARKGSPAIIPVVVHVVYKTAEENITDAQIASQLVVLNNDYAALNDDKDKTPEVWKGLVTSVNLQFQLASIDGEGNPTNGITRTMTTKESFPSDDTVKSSATGGKDPWPTDRFLNIWVCNLADGLLGYAQFPGGPATTDGIVILYAAFGTEGTATAPFNKGRTLTHEVGHFFNLYHIWGDTQHCEGTDFVADTPNQQLPNYGKPVFPHITCNNGPNGDMFMNYMDYVDDDAMVMFTSGQVARMNATLDGPRKNLPA